MKSLLKIVLIFAIVAIVHSCRKESLIPEISNPEPIDHAKDFLKGQRIDRSSPYYIRGEFDGKVISFTTISGAYYYDETSWSALYLNYSNGLDQINLIRENKDHSIQLAIFISQAKLLKSQLPFNIPNENQVGSENVNIQLINLHRMWEVDQQGTNDDDFRFDGTTIDQSLKFQVTSFVDDILEGTFEGSLSTRSGSTIIVKNGRFHIKINKIIYDN